MWVCHFDSEEIQFVAKNDHCFAKEKVEAKEAGIKPDAKRYGDRLRPEIKLPDGKELIDYREPYYRDLAKRQADSEDPEISH